MSDLISRQDLLKLFENLRDEHETNAISYVALYEVILKQPTIEAVPVVHGEWIKAENTWVCSVCHKENACAYDETLCRFTDFFCPKCGAKMKGGA